MPEMPEVEHFKQYFNRTSLRHTIERVRCANKRLLIGGSLATINKELKGHQFKHADRRGKFLIASVAGSDKKVVFHFGLTGFFYYKKEKEAQGKAYAKVIFQFSNGDELQWINKRNFGRVYVVTDLAKIKALTTMGPEATQLSARAFTQILKAHENAVIKTLLMDQQVIAGIGNDYSNELLFAAGIYPKTKTRNVSNAQKGRLYRALKRVLLKATHLRISEREEQFPRSWLLAHKKDMICPKNKNHRLKKMRIGGRTVLYCPEHQPK